MQSYSRRHLLFDARHHCTNDLPAIGRTALTKQLVLVTFRSLLQTRACGSAFLAAAEIDAGSGVLLAGERVERIARRGDHKLRAVELVRDRAVGQVGVEASVPHRSSTRRIERNE